jgi:hypothetical protein
MKPHTSAIQYTIRGVPPEVDAVLRRRAAHRKKSLNQVLLEELARAAGEQRHADFSDLVGKWTPDPAFDRIIAAQRRIDRDRWK